jgi:hypothetical protein
MDGLMLPGIMRKQHREMRMWDIANTSLFCFPRGIGHM